MNINNLSESRYFFIKFKGGLAVADSALYAEDMMDKMLQKAGNFYGSMEDAIRRARKINEIIKKG